MFIKRNWVEILVFGAILAVLLVCNAPGMTWINTDSDGAHYIYSAKYTAVAHNTSAPLFLLIGKLFLLIPLGTEAWRMGLISVLATTIACIFIYKVVYLKLQEWRVSQMVLRNKRIRSVVLRARIYSLIAAVLYGGSALVISQSTIIETYALSTMLSVIAYYACLQRRWVWASVTMGLMLAIHPLFFLFTWFVLFIAYKELRNIKLFGITIAFVVFYAYIPISKMFGESSDMWGNTSLSGFFRNNFGTMWMLAGTLSLWDIPKRFIDTVLIYIVSMGLGSVVLIWYYIKKRTVKDVTLWMVVLPVFYFIVNLSAETYVYMIPAIAFGAIAVGVAMSKVKPVVMYSTALIAVALMGFNANYLDIGRTLDPNLSAQRYFDEELDKIPDGEILLAGGWTWAIVPLYNRENNRNIIPICTDVLPSDEYLDIIEANGVKLTRTDSKKNLDQQWLVAKSIVEQNDNVWMAKETIPSEFQYEIVPAQENMYLVERWIGYEKQPEIAWKPSNPYHYITGALEVSEWKFIIYSNINARFAIMCAVYAIAAYWLALKLFRKKDKGHGEVPVETEAEADGTRTSDS